MKLSESNIFSISVIFFSAIGIGMRLLLLDYQSLWGDEIYTALLSQHDLPLWYIFNERILGDVHPPLYIIIMHYWTMLTGVSEITLRIPSVFFSILTIIVAFFYARRLLPKDALYFFLALISCSYAGIYFAQEARSYALLILFSTVITLSTININVQIKNLSHVSYKALLAYSVFGLLASFTHYFGAIVFGTSLIALVILNYRNKRMLFAFCFIGAITLSIVFAWVVFHHSHMIKGAGPGSTNDPQVILKTVKLIIGPKIALILLTGAIVYAIFKKAGKLHLDQTTSYPLLLIIILTIAFAQSIGIIKPITTDRNYLILMPAVLFLIAHILEKNLSKKIFYYLSALIICSMIAGNIMKYYRHNKQQWRESVQWILSLDGCKKANIIAMPRSNVIVKKPDIRVPNSNITVQQDGLELYRFYFNYYLGDNHKVELKSLDDFEQDSEITSWLLKDNCPIIYWNTRAKMATIESKQEYFEKLLQKDLALKTFRQSAIIYEPAHVNPKTAIEHKE